MTPTQIRAVCASLAIVLSLSIILASCQSVAIGKKADYFGVKKRITKNLSKYHKLSESDQELVRKGELTKGMSAAAVLIAWGDPDEISETIDDGIQSEQWSWVEQGEQMHYQSTIGWGNRINYGAYRDQHCPRPRAKTDLIKIEYVAKSVTMIDQQVVEWTQN